MGKKCFPFWCFIDDKTPIPYNKTVLFFSTTLDRKRNTMRIGLLEDNSAIHEYLTTVLQLSGHTVSTHTDGLSLLDELLAEQSAETPLPYDLVIVDILLPGTLSGLAVINSIRQNIPPETLPIIVVSAASQHQLEQIRERFPDVQVLQKPFPMKTLLELIESKHVGDTI
ncbi:MAG: response regulator [Chloroflexi bacterium]|nr:MAG: response regulator [Chloroflexota bacterium]